MNNVKSDALASRLSSQLEWYGAEGVDVTEFEYERFDPSNVGFQLVFVAYRTPDGEEWNHELRSDRSVHPNVVVDAIAATIARQVGADRFCHEFEAALGGAIDAEGADGRAVDCVDTVCRDGEIRVSARVMGHPFKAKYEWDGDHSSVSAIAEKFARWCAPQAAAL